MSRSEKDKMLAGELYRPGDAEIQADQAATKKWLVHYNASLGLSAAERRVLLAERFAEVGAGAVVRPPFHCDYGFNIRLGANAFLNYNSVILDVVEVSIGEGAQIGSSARSGAAPCRFRIRPPRADRQIRVDRRRGDCPSRRQHRR
jgi:maltose O-acetyltransferase